MLDWMGIINIIITISSFGNCANKHTHTHSHESKLVFHIWEEAAAGCLHFQCEE